MPVSCHACVRRALLLLRTHMSFSLVQGSTDVTRSKGPSPAALQTLLKRQQTVRWRDEYEPGMQATVAEAPKVSRPSTLYWRALNRQLHFMSLGERHLAMLALYHPRLWDLHEQHMLSPFPAPHPLDGHPVARGLRLTPLQGTLAVTQRLGGAWHLNVTEYVVTDTGETKPHVKAYPYLGDLLLFLQDDDGPYVVNWNIKASGEGFSKDPYGVGNALRRTRRDEWVAFRQDMEEEYFRDAGIRTVRIGADQLDSGLVATLTHLSTWVQRDIKVDAVVQQYLIGQYQESMQAQMPPMSVFARLESDTGRSRQECLAVLYSSIWHRTLRVDLYKPILMDHPLRPELSDVLVDHGHWFAR